MQLSNDLRSFEQVVKLFSREKSSPFFRHRVNFIKKLVMLTNSIPAPSLTLTICDIQMVVKSGTVFFFSVINNKTKA